jgi:type III secretion system FlhB-like substrate exporter
MLAAVPQATVVITNPTHYAVRLAYEPGQSAAPRIVAKGVDSMAARIREAAREAGRADRAGPPLARALHRLRWTPKFRPSIGMLWQRTIAIRPASARPGVTADFPCSWRIALSFRAKQNI